MSGEARRNIGTTLKELYEALQDAGAEIGRMHSVKPLVRLEQPARLALDPEDQTGYCLIILGETSTVNEDVVAVATKPPFPEKLERVIDAVDVEVMLELGLAKFHGDDLVWNGSDNSDSGFYRSHSPSRVGLTSW